MRFCVLFAVCVASLHLSPAKAQPPSPLTTHLSDHARRILAEIPEDDSEVAMARPLPTLSHDAPPGFVPLRQISCMAKTGYAEARGEGWQGMRAVQWVLVNRAKAAGTSPCTEVQRPGAFTGRTGRPHAPGDLAMLKTAWDCALRIWQGIDRDPTHGALFFQRGRPGHHLPAWAGTPTAYIGAHVFSTGSFHPN